MRPTFYRWRCFIKVTNGRLQESPSFVFLRVQNKLRREYFATDNSSKSEPCEIAFRDCPCSSQGSRVISESQARMSHQKEFLGYIPQAGLTYSVRLDKKQANGDLDEDLIKMDRIQTFS